MGNELDLDKYGLHYSVLIPRAIEVVQKLNAAAPDYFITIPVSNWQHMEFFKWFKNGDGATITPIPASIYGSRFYNSVQTFKHAEGLLTTLLPDYDAPKTSDTYQDGLPAELTKIFAGETP